MKKEKKVRITSGTKEWATYTVNCMNGCYHNCRYCYAKVIAKRFKRHTDRSWKNMRTNEYAVAKKYGKKNGRIMFPSSHDICGFPHVKEACFTVLTKLLKAGNEVLITTKPTLSLTKEITSKLVQYKEQIQFRFTITSAKDSILSFWEPNAPSFNDRLRSLKHAYAKNYRTSVSIEPFLDEDPTALVEKVSPFVTESIWIGKMNYIPNGSTPKRYKLIYNHIRENYTNANLRMIYNKLRNYPQVRFKDSITIKLGVNGNQFNKKV